MERQKHLYEKAKSYNKEGDLRNDNSLVYVIQLFNILYPGQQQHADYDVRFSAFKNVLNDWFKVTHEYDKAALKFEVNKRVDIEPYRKYHIVFGIPVNTTSYTPFPFHRSLKMGNVTFRRRTWEVVKKIDGGAFEEELAEAYRKERYSKFQANQIIHSMHYFEAEAGATRESVAVNEVFDTFALFSASATVAQERFTTVHYLLSQIKSRKPILNPYLFYVKGNPKTGVYTDADSTLSLPDEKLNFTKDKAKLDAYKRYLRIMLTDSPTLIEQRIKSVILEFDKALHLTDPHLRALSLWRCLELATRKSNQETRKQNDFIAIVANFSPSDPWKERGRLLSDFRNKYIHGGETLRGEVRDHYLAWLQDYASAMLSLLTWMKSHGVGKTSTELDDFFDLYSLPDAKLELATKMLRAKKRLRQR